MNKTVGTIYLKDIVIGSRFRREYHKDEIKELAKSIEEQGLIQPIAVEYRDEQYHLLAGGRRCKAFTFIKPYMLNEKKIECRIYSNLEPWERDVIELAENIFRKNMTWAEEATARAAIHQKYVEARGDAMRGKGQSLEKTAQLLGVSTATLSQDINITKQLKQFPNLAKEETKRAAQIVMSNLTKAVKRETNIKKAKKLIAEVELEPKRVDASDPKKQTDLAKLKVMDKFIVSDFFAYAPSLPKKYFDFFEVDYDYGIDYKATKKEKTKGKDINDEHYTESRRENYPNEILEIARITYELALDNAWLIFWYAMEWHQTIIDTFESVGWHVVKIPALWIKDGGRNQAPNSRLTPSYEQFLYMQKGTPQLAKHRNALYQYRTVPQSVRGHITPKPIRMYEDIISTFVESNQNVLVPFAGSGASLHALANLGYENYLGCDKAAENKEEFISRTLKQNIGEYDNYVDIYKDK